MRLEKRNTNTVKEILVPIRNLTFRQVRPDVTTRFHYRVIVVGTGSPDLRDRWQRMGETV